MSEAVCGVTTPSVAAGPSSAQAVVQHGMQSGGQAQSPTGHNEQHTQQQQVGSPLAAAAAAAAEEDEQLKYHHQMLYPTPGLRNYGFDDEFMIHTFKVVPCERQEKHARGSCPYAHPGDVAQRRHPDAYQALLCPEVRAKKVCPRGDDCQCSHSAFEFWLHPQRYRTSMCEKGERCSRPVCFFAHNAKELRPLPDGLKPAVPTPEETAKRHHGSIRAGSVPGMVSSPRDMAGFPAGYQAPAFAREGMQAMYMQGMGLQGRPQTLQQQQQQQQQYMGFAPAGYAPAAAGYAPAGTQYAAAPTGYRIVPAPPALDVSMPSQYQTVMGNQYMPQSPILSPNAGLQQQTMGGNTMILTGGPAAAATGQPFSPVGARGSQSSGGVSSAGGMWQQAQPQQLQQGAQQQVAGTGVATTPTGGGMQLPDAMLQQFQQLGVGATAVAPTTYDATQAGMIPTMQAHPAQYAQQQVMYVQSGAEQGWVQQQMPAQQQQMQYGLQQYSAQAIDPQCAQQAPMMGRMLPAQMSPAGLVTQQQVPAGAYTMQGDAQAALAQNWGAGSVVLSPQGPGAALMRPPSAGQNPYDAQGGW